MSQPNGMQTGDSGRPLKCEFLWKSREQATPFVTKGRKITMRKLVFGVSAFAGLLLAGTAHAQEITVGFVT